MVMVKQKCNYCTKMGDAFVARFSYCRVRINAKDHPPPHLHVLLNDGREAWVTIAEQKIVHGKVAPMLAATFEELQR